MWNVIIRSYIALLECPILDSIFGLALYNIIFSYQAYPLFLVELVNIFALTQLLALCTGMSGRASKKTSLGYYFKGLMICLEL